MILPGKSNEQIFNDLKSKSLTELINMIETYKVNIAHIDILIANNIFKDKQVYLHNRKYLELISDELTLKIELLELIIDIKREEHEPS